MTKQIELDHAAKLKRQEAEDTTHQHLREERIKAYTSFLSQIDMVRLASSSQTIHSRILTKITRSMCAATQTNILKS
jgi:hypothetical protein